ncbi:MAG: tetratricopeptide repeat protein [Gammaproteobacteria bacterium]|nr:tetratricopeptide repeat protein [Gammaproteobacteria bacterium]
MVTRSHHIAIAVLLLGLVFDPTPVQAAQQQALSPQLAERLNRILKRADEDAAWTLQQLADLARRRRNDPQDLRFILRQRGALLMQEDQLDTAANELTEALDQHGVDYAPELRFLLGQILLLMDDAESALVHLNIWAEHAQPPDPAGLFLMGYSYVRLERFEAAADVLERAIATASTPRAQWIEILAYAYTRLDRTGQALQLLEDLITRHPQEARWWRQLASIYLLIEDVPRGAAGLAVAAEIEALSFADSRNLAQLFAHLNMPADGAYLLNAALQQRDEASSHDELMLLAELWILAREFDAAVDVLGQAAEVGEDGEALLMLGHLYLQRENYPRASISLNAAISAYGEQTPPQAFYLLAVVAINLEDFDAAQRALVRLDDDAKFAPRAARLQRYLQSRNGA